MHMERHDRGIHALSTRPREQTDRQWSSEAERAGYPPGQIVLGYRGVDVDHGQSESGSLLAEPVGEHRVAFEQVVQGLVWIAGLPGDMEQRAAVLERGAAEAGRRAEPDRLAADGQERAPEAGQPR